VLLAAAYAIVEQATTCVAVINLKAAEYNRREYFKQNTGHASQQLQTYKLQTEEVKVLD
jgi:hypothetical protein